MTEVKKSLESKGWDVCSSDGDCGIMILLLKSLLVKAHIDVTYLFDLSMVLVFLKYY